jgi:predicted Ser/Thr protein kinase
MAEGDRLVADRYLLHEQVGRGGMGVVWRADDQVLGRCVAVKEVHLQPGLSDEERQAVQQRVMREARAAASIDHTGAVTVYDVAEQDGQAYIVMELIDAPTLADLVEDQGPLDPAEVARIGLAVLDVLAVAHARGIVHRDLKPANVMVCGDDRVKLTDFGIATMKDDPRLTSTGIVLGSPSYISPEQALGKTPSDDTDLWGLGATLFYAACGRPPFDRGEAIATLTAVAHEELDVDSCAGPLAPVLRRMLNKNPDDRPSLPELRGQLSAIAEERGVDTSTMAVATTPEATQALPALDAALDPAPTSAAPASAAPTGARVPAEPPRRRGGRLLLLLLVPLLLLLAAAAVLLRPGGGGRDRAGSGDASRYQGELVAWTHPQAGYTVHYPKGWLVQPKDGSTTDFREPNTGRYLRVGWTATPSDNPVAAWESGEQAFQSKYPVYDRIRIEGSKFRGHDAAIWEWTYKVERELHAINLGWVDGERGYALNFQTRAADWDRSQDLWDALQEGFETPAS